MSGERATTYRVRILNAADGDPGQGRKLFEVLFLSPREAGREIRIGAASALDELERAGIPSDAFALAFNVRAVEGGRGRELTVAEWADFLDAADQQANEPAGGWEMERVR